MTLLSLATAAPPVALSSIARELGMDYVQRGNFLAAVFWGITICMLFAGPLADRVGLRPPLLAGTGLYVLGCLLVAQAENQWTAWTGALVLGAGAGVSDALFTPIVCVIFPQRRTRMSNLLHAFFAVGMIITILLMMMLFARGVPWRPTFRLLAILPAPLLVTLLLLPLPRGSHAGPERLPTRRIVYRRAFVGLALTIFLVGITEMGPGTWLPNYVEELAAGSRMRGALGLLIFSVTLAAGRLSGSAIVHKLGVRRLFGGAMVLAAGALLLAALPVGPVFTIVWLGVLAFVIASVWPTILACAGDQFPQAGASMFSLLASVGNFGGVAGPALVGAIAEVGGLHAAMGALAAAPLAALACVFLLARPGR